MSRYAVEQRTVSDAVDGGRLVEVAQWEAKEGQADNVADILSRFLPEVPGVDYLERSASTIVSGWRAGGGRALARPEPALQPKHSLHLWV